MPEENQEVTKKGNPALGLPEKLKKADFFLADLSAGGLLTVAQNQSFIRNMIDQPTLLNQVRVVEMDTPSLELNKIGFGKRILRAASEGVALADAAVDGTSFDPSTAGEATARAKPQTSKVTLNTHEVLAEVRITYSALEDSIERGNLENTIYQLIGERSALDLEELIINGDTSLNTDDTYLDLTDGALKLSTAHVVDANGAGVSANIFNSVLKALPTKYRRNRSSMRFFTSMDVEQDYRLALSTRGTGLGDAILTGQQAVPVFGVPLVGAALMPQSNILFTNPKNIIFGIQRNLRIEAERLISEREVKIVLTARVAVQIEETDAVVKVTNLG